MLLRQALELSRLGLGCLEIGLCFRDVQLGQRVIHTQQDGPGADDLVIDDITANVSTDPRPTAATSAKAIAATGTRLREARAPPVAGA